MFILIFLEDLLAHSC